jgi:hypothetical protein
LQTLDKGAENVKNRENNLVKGFFAVVLSLAFIVKGPKIIEKLTVCNI